MGGKEFISIQPLRMTQIWDPHRTALENRVNPLGLYWLSLDPHRTLCHLSICNQPLGYGVLNPLGQAREHLSPPGMTRKAMWTHWDNQGTLLPLLWHGTNVGALYMYVRIPVYLSPPLDELLVVGVCPTVVIAAGCNSGDRVPAKAMDRAWTFISPGVAGQVGVTWQAHAL